MYKQINKGFTLVELIVVITILAILGTIAFISMQQYAKSARDSARMSDMSKIKTTLELFHLNAGKYPESTDVFDVRYSGALAWTQGTFGAPTFTNVEKLDKVPLDPLTDRQYIYSVTNTKQEFEIAQIMETYEGGTLGSLINDEVYAGDRKANLRITGKYNGKILKVSTGGLTYILAVPSIITSTGGTLKYVIDNASLAYDGYRNLPAQYSGSLYDVEGEEGGLLLVNPNNIEVFSGSLDLLSQTDQAGEDARTELIENLQDAYNGTDIENEGGIAEIVNATSTDEIEFVATTIVSNDLGGSIEISGTPPGSSLGACTWVSKFDNTFWVPQDTESDYWDEGGNLVLTNLSSEVKDVGTWNDTYKPEKMRVTFTKTGEGSPQSVPVKLQFGAEEGPYNPEGNVSINDYTSGDVIELTFEENPQPGYGIVMLNFSKVSGEDPSIGVTISDIEFCDNSGEGTPDDLGNDEGEGGSILNITCEGLEGEHNNGEGFDYYDLCTNQTELFIDGESKNVPYSSLIGGEGGEGSSNSDLYGLILEGGNTYEFAFENTDSCDGTCNFEGGVLIFDNEGNEIYSFDGYSEDGGINKTTINVSDDSVYYVIVNEGYWSLSFPYTINIYKQEPFATGIYQLMFDYLANYGYSISQGFNDNLIEYNGRLYFSTVGDGLLSIDTEGNVENFGVYTHFISSNIYNSYRRQVVEFNGNLYFIGLDAEGYEHVLYYIDSSNTLHEIVGSPSLYNAEQLVVFNNRLYFNGFIDGAGYELAYIDSSNNIGYHDVNSGTSSSNANGLTVFNNKLYFIASNSTTGAELYFLNSDFSIGYHDIVAGSGSGLSYDDLLIPYNNGLYFSKNNDFYKLDTSNNYNIVYLGSSYINSSIVYNNRIYFREGSDLSYIDTSNNVTNLGIFDSNTFTVFNNRLYFGGNDYSDYGYIDSSDNYTAVPLGLEYGIGANEVYSGNMYFFEQWACSAMIYKLSTSNNISSNDSIFVEGTCY